MRRSFPQRLVQTLRRLPAFGILTFLFLSSAAAQRIAILAPDGAVASRTFREKLSFAFGEKSAVLDAELADTAYAAAPPSTPFNLTTDETRRLTSAIGCDYLLLIKSEMLRRSSFQRKEYYEAYAAVWLTSARTGRLVYWKNYSFEDQIPSKAATMLESSVATIAHDVSEAVRRFQKSEISEPAEPVLAEPPDRASPSAKNFRPPVPYRRVKPDYTSEAGLYEITATVEIVVDLDASGRITRTEIVRWTGYGLDESVERAVRSMTWRPAERDGKALPMRFMLRYNFKKLDK